MTNNTRGGCVTERLKTPLLATHFNIQCILNLEASRHSLLSFEWTLPRPANVIATKYCFLIHGDDTSFLFILFVMLCHCTYFIIIIFLQKLFS